VTLYVSQSAEGTVPDVVGMHVADAERKIRDAGYQPKSEKKYSPNVEEGKVVSTDPKAKTPLAQGEQVIIYMAVPDDPAKVDMPSLIGWTLDEAEAILESVKLKLNRDDVPEIDSNELEGKVAEQSIQPKVKVSKGTEISVSISNGTGASQSAIVTVPMPNTGVETTVRVYLDGIQVKEETIIVRSSYSVTVEGKRPASLEVRLDGKKVYTATVNFDKTPPTLTNEQTYDSRPTVPNVVGQSEEQAKQTLRDAGYNNIVVEPRTAFLGIAAGQVADQSPRGNTPADYDTEITIVVNQ
jgi:serine/threonine-protein kinase